MPATNQFFVAPGYQPLARELGLDAETVFTHPSIRCWRKLADRQNCTLDADLADGRHLRLHIKRYSPSEKAISPAEEEFQGHQLLLSHGIPTANFVAWGTDDRERSFVVLEDLAGYTPADKLIAGGGDFSLLSQPIADIASKLHQTGLQHRDLYLCHFMANVEGDEADVRLIDPARVRRLPNFLTRGRWIVKDLAQFWYSTTKLPISEAQRAAWLFRYCQQRQHPGTQLLRSKIERKVRRIARHDAKLNQVQPDRNISIPW